MRQSQTISVIIPALNEALAIGRVIGQIPEWVDEIMVVDNGSTDATAGIAAGLGATVIAEPVAGYGNACLTGIAALRGPDVVVFLDADFSDHPQEMARLTDPILRGEADLVIGSRTRGRAEAGALLPQARFGNWLACALIRLFWGHRYSDLGPFRAIRYPKLRALDMADRDYGWTVEMQIKALQHGLKVTEAPVSYRRRIGKSKISGTIKGIVLAGTKILSTIFRQAIRRKSAVLLRRKKPRRSGQADNQKSVTVQRYPL